MLDIFLGILLICAAVFVAVKSGYAVVHWSSRGSYMRELNRKVGDPD